MTITYFLNAMEMATVSSSCRSASEKSPKLEKTVVGLFFDGLLVEGAEAAVCQQVEPLVVAPELAGTGPVSLGVGSSWTAELTCGEAFFGLLSWLVGPNQLSEALSPLVPPSASGGHSACSASDSSPPFF